MGRNLRLLVLAASTAVLAAAAASAAPGGSAPSPKLTLTDVVVGAADLGPGTLVLADKTTKLGGVPFLVRVIVTGTAGNPTTLLIFAGIERTADAAYSDYAETRTHSVKRGECIGPKAGGVIIPTVQRNPGG